MEIYVIVWIVCGIATLLLAQSRGVSNPASWFLVGVLFGPIGILLALIGARPGKPKKGEVMDQIRDLAQLRADGQLSEQEYEEKKRTLLARI